MNYYDLTIISQLPIRFKTILFLQKKQLYKKLYYKSLEMIHFEYNGLPTRTYYTLLKGTLQ